MLKAFMEFYKAGSEFFAMKGKSGATNLSLIHRTYVIIHNMIVNLYEPKQGCNERNEAGESVSNEELASEFINFGEQDNLPSNSCVHFRS